MFRRLWVCSLLSVGLATAAGGADAAEAPDKPIVTAPPADSVDTVYVWGRREGRIGTAASASEGQVSYGAYAERPLLRPGELAEVIPDLAVTQHSGSGKANQ